MRFDIELLGFDGEAPIEGLAHAFDVDLETAHSIAARAPVFVKRDVDETTAEGYFHVLRELGGRVKLHKRATTAPPSSPSSVPPPAISARAPIELEIDPFARTSVPPTPRSTSPPTMVEAVSIPDLAIELEEVPRPIAPPSTTGAPAAATAGVSRETAPIDRPIEDRGGYLEAVARAYLYPFQLSALPALILVPLLTQLVSYAPLVIGIFLSNGIWVTYLFAVTKHASLGEKDLPLTPDTENWLDMIAPVMRYLLAFLVPGVLIFGLLVLLTGGIASLDGMVTGGHLTMASVPVLVFVALGLWLLYLPASLILAAHSRGCLGGLNLIAGVKLIVREPVGYTITLGGIMPALLAMIGISIVTKVLDQMILIPFLPGFVGLLIAFIPSLIVARILGLYLWHYEEELSIS